MTNQPTNCEPLLKEPIYPEDWECCNNGCDELCVYEIYRIQKQAYDSQQARIKANKYYPKPNGMIISPNRNFL